MNFTWIIGLLLVGVSASAAYISWHIWQLVPFGILGKWLAVAAILLCFFCLFLNTLLDKMPMPLATALYGGGHVVYIYRLILANAVCGVRPS